MLNVLVCLITSSTAATPSIQHADTIVRIAGEPLYRGVSQVVEETSISSAARANDDGFSFVSDIAVDKNGTMFILDFPLMGTPRADLFDVTGKFLRSVGGVGRERGQFLQPAAVAAMPDGRFLLYDRPYGRIVVYNANGDALDTWGIGTRSVGLGIAGTMSVDSAGIIALRISSQLKDGRPGCAGVNNTILRIRPGATIIDELRAPELPDLCRGVGKRRDRGTHTDVRGIAMPYIPAAIWRYSPQGFFIFGISDRYSINIQRPRHSVLSVRMNAHPIPISAAERAEQKRHVEALLASFEGELEGQIEDVPTSKPFFKALYAADDGRIWVKIHAPSERKSQQQANAVVSSLAWHEPTLLDVFDETGIYVGRVRIPDNVRILKLRGDQIWAATRLENGQDAVKRYRVVWNDRA